MLFLSHLVKSLSFVRRERKRGNNALGVSSFSVLCVWSVENRK